MAELPIRVVKVLPAPPEVVFDAWIDPASLRAWMCPGSVVESIATIDARVGGRFRIVMRDRASEYVHTGEYVEIDRPKHLVFTWMSDGVRGQLTRVTVELQPHGDSATELTLIHEAMPDADARRQHEGGWRQIVDRLAQWLLHATPGTDHAAQ
jgi:uncharacterized protein YndB with AHSA1/START domain